MSKLCTSPIHKPPSKFICFVPCPHLDGGQDTIEKIEILEAL